MGSIGDIERHEVPINELMRAHESLFQSHYAETPNRFERATAYDYVGPVTPSSGTAFKEGYGAELERRT